MYNRDMDIKRLGDIAKISSGSTPARNNQDFWNGDIPWVSTGELSSGFVNETREHESLRAVHESSLKLLKPGTLLMAMYGQGKTRGIVSRLNITATTNQACASIEIKKDEPSYVYYFLQFRYESIRKLSNGGSQENLSTEIIKKIKIGLPPIAEQRKIAEILSTQDRIIELKTKLLEEKKLLKKYLCQTLLSGKRRFPSYHEPWNKVCLSSILKEKTINCKNQNLRVYSVSVDVGVVDQIEHLGRSYAARDISKYTVVEKGDVIYTKSPTGLFPFGIVKQSQMDASGAVSPLYAVYSPKSIELGYLLHTYFSYPLNTTNYLKSLIQRGPKNTMSISNSDFLTKALHLPVDKDEIARLSDLFKQIDIEIRIMANNIEQENLKKKALMQQLLTGKIRVTV